MCRVIFQGENLKVLRSKSHCGTFFEFEPQREISLINSIPVRPFPTLDISVTVIPSRLFLDKLSSLRTSLQARSEIPPLSSTPRHLAVFGGVSRQIGAFEEMSMIRLMDFNGSCGRLQIIEANYEPIESPTHLFGIPRGFMPNGCVFTHL